MRILIDPDGKKIFVKETSRDEISTHFGILKKSHVFMTKNGAIVKSHLGKKFTVINPNIVDYFQSMSRGPAIVLLKDAGIISAFTGIGPGSIVVEAGSGSGALTGYLANLVRPNGKVYSYEVKDKFLDIAKKNLNYFGLSDHVVFKNKDISKGIAEKEVDAVILDLPEPWKVVKKAEKALKPGGFFVSYIPTTNQLIRLEETLSKSKFTLLKVLDVKAEEWKVGKATRPTSNQLTHTAFIVIYRKY